jgi:hypothetical protein
LGLYDFLSNNPDKILKLLKTLKSNKMKKYNFKNLFLFLGLILIFSCQDDSISSESFKKNDKIFINKDETVDVSIFKYGSKTFRLNPKEKSFIDLNDNNLKVPVIIEDKKTKISNLNNSLQPTGVCIVIARKKPPRKPGKCGNCECGLGFRCRVFSCDDDGNPTII